MHKLRRYHQDVVVCAYKLRTAVLLLFVEFLIHVATLFLRFQIYFLVYLSLQLNTLNATDNFKNWTSEFLF